MKKIKNLLAFALLLIGLFAFKKPENNNKSILSNLDKQKIIETLTKQEFGCRPSSELNFYVETAILKKYRGYAKIEAKIFVLNKLSNQKSMLASEEIIVANHKESLLNFDTITNNSETAALENGHIIVYKNNNGFFKLEDLLSYELIATSYILSTNRLLNM